ncbi:MAG: MoaD/ThiS family protein [Treponema sp.]|nr:MoaD/ThiS family protein [Treponema sp.]
MKVLFYGNALDYTNGDRFFDAKDCASIRGLIDELCNYYGEKLKDFLLGEETCFFLVNGKGLMMTGGLDTKIHPDDRIEVLPFAEAG